MMSKKKNVVLLCGYDMGTIPDKIRNFERVPHKGDWRRFKIIEDITYKMATVNWQLLNSSEWADDVLVITGAIPCGMEELYCKLTSTYNRDFQSLPSYIVDHFEVRKETFHKSMFKIDVSFSSEAHVGKFWLAYCKFCSCKNKLKSEFWDKYGDKLPNEVSIENLMRHWDNLKLSWNYIDYLGCIMPTNVKHYALINGRRFLQRAYGHFNSVHEKSSGPNLKKHRCTTVFGVEPSKKKKVADQNTGNPGPSSSSSHDAKTPKVKCAKKAEYKLTVAQIA